MGNRNDSHMVTQFHKYQCVREARQQGTANSQIGGNSLQSRKRRGETFNQRQYALDFLQELSTQPDAPYIIARQQRQSTPTTPREQLGSRSLAGQAILGACTGFCPGESRSAVKGGARPTLYLGNPFLFASSVGGQLRLECGQELRDKPRPLRFGKPQGLLEDLVSAHWHAASLAFPGIGRKYG